MSGLADFYGPNAGYVAELQERAEREPEALDARTRASLAGLRRAAGEPMAPLPLAGGVEVSAAAAAVALAEAIRFYGHLSAQLDPLGSPPPGDPLLDPLTHGLREADLARIPPDVVGGPIAPAARSAAEAIQRLRGIYGTTTGYELVHVEDPDERAWLLEAIESERFRPPADPIDEHHLLDRLTELSAFERFLHRAYPGQTRFSIEGLGSMIPMLDELIDRAADDGTRTIVLGMAHRGRLNVLAHVLGKPYERILAEFEGIAPRPRPGPTDGADEGWTGDVKYHAGARRAYATEDERGAVTVIMAPNPSHLEFVDPVVEGMARAAAEGTSAADARATRRTGDEAEQGEAALPAARRGVERALAVLIHGDASFPGQGIVAETLNLSRLAGYTTGGTIHLIANNQLGFTTVPRDDRSTLYASDLAKGFEIPIVHVNASDPMACLAAVRLAVAYRNQFHKDFLIDLIGYRRWGHNEGDEPSLTQPLLYARIARQPTVREQYAGDLERRGVIRAGEAEALLRAGLDEFQRIREGVLARKQGTDATLLSPNGHTTVGDARRANAEAKPVSLAALRSLNEALIRFPDGFQLNPKLERPIGRRRAAFDAPGAPIDWGHAEMLAFGSILRDGTPIRLTGQDTVRGTFSQRHLTFFDAVTGAPYTPLEHIADARAAFAAWNSPLSESAALGFEYGFSVQSPRTLVLWEAQYGDFVNGAQVIVDEFLVSAQAKWGLLSGLVLLLPHAWEGQGPDHSSGRLERFLQLSAENNVRVVNCTTATQYFHLLRRQAALLDVDPRPLVVMTPKSLLRHPLAATTADALARTTRFSVALDDARAAESRARVRRVVLCSGKVWADVESDPRRSQADALAVIRVEELYPFPEREIREILAAYPNREEVVWLQEEPRNMGAWTFMEPCLRVVLERGEWPRYVGRPERASPAEGTAATHGVEQRRIVDAIFAAQPAARAAGRRERAKG